LESIFTSQVIQISMGGCIIFLKGLNFYLCCKMTLGSSMLLLRAVELFQRSRMGPPCIHAKFASEIMTDNTTSNENEKRLRLCGASGAD
jgi:hypothetical protein